MKNQLNKLTGSKTIKIGMCIVLSSVTLTCLADWFEYCRHYPHVVTMNAPGEPGYSDCQTRSYPNCNGDVCGIITDEYHCSGTIVPNNCPSTCDSIDLIGNAHCTTLIGGNCNCQ